MPVDRTSMLYRMCQHSRPRCRLASNAEISTWRVDSSYRSFHHQANRFAACIRCIGEIGSFRWDAVLWSSPGAQCGLRFVSQMVNKLFDWTCFIFAVGRKRCTIFHHLPFSSRDFSGQQIWTADQDSWSGWLITGHLVPALFSPSAAFVLVYALVHCVRSVLGQTLLVQLFRTVYRILQIVDRFEITLESLQFYGNTIVQRSLEAMQTLLKTP